MLLALLWAMPMAGQTPLQQRADSVTATFWDTFFTQDDSVRLRSAEAKPTHTSIETEQRVVDFLALLPHATDGGRQVAVDRWLSLATHSDSCLQLMADLAEKYLFDQESPMRDEQLYMLVLQRLATTPHMAVATRSQHQLQLLSRNAPGTIATDFAFATADGQRHTLHTTATDRLLLLVFYDPDCHQCRDALFTLRHSSLLSQAVAQRRLSVVAVYAGDDRQLWLDTCTEMPPAWTVATATDRLTQQQLYMLEPLPQLYLLSPEKKVLLRGAKPTDIVAYLTANFQ